MWFLLHSAFGCPSNNDESSKSMFAVVEGISNNCIECSSKVPRKRARFDIYRSVRCVLGSEILQNFLVNFVVFDNGTDPFLCLVLQGSWAQSNIKKLVYQVFCIYPVYLEMTRKHYRQSRAL